LFAVFGGDEGTGGNAEKVERFMSDGTLITENGLLTRAALAKVLVVSVSTVDRMLADGEITPIRLRGKLVRFHLPDVLAELREKAQTSKHSCTRREPVTMQRVLS
jgi:excisionase family DNA binding protein